MTTISLNTTRFGEIQIEPSRVISFVSPILGFEALSRYVILDHSPDSPFQWLQSTEDMDLAFVVTNPSLFGIAYEVALDATTVEQLEIKSIEDAIVLTIATIPQDNPTYMTANLVAPVVINPNTMKAMQVVLNESVYSTKTRLIPDEMLSQISTPSPSDTEG